MSRPKDNDRRFAIVATAKALFARSGFDAVSMNLLAAKVGIPVGSLYTYFESKERLLACIVEEGWGEFISFMEMGMAESLADMDGGEDARARNLLRLSFLIYKALPTLFEDVDLISILLSRAGKSSGLEGKFEYLSGLVVSIVESLQVETEKSHKSDAAMMRTGLAVMLLGSFEVMRLSKHANIGIDAGRIISFLAATVESALGCRLPDLEPVKANKDFSEQAIS